MVQNSPEVGDDRGGVGNGGGVGDGARDVADTVVDHALLNIAGILMGGLMEGLDGPVVIIADVHDDRALPHQLQHGPVDEEVVAALGPFDAVEHHIRIRQQLGDVLLGTQHGVDVLLVLPLQRAQDPDVDVHDRDPGPQGIQDGQSGLAHRAAAQNQHPHGWRAAQSADELALAAVDGQHGLQAHQGALLAGGLTVGGAVPVAVLRGEGDAAAVQDGLDLLGVGGGMDAGEDDLSLPQQREFTGLQLLHLGDKVGLAVDVLHGVHQARPGLLILLILEASLLSRAPLHQGGVSVRHNGGDFRRGGNGAVLPVFDVFQQSKYHVRFLQICSRSRGHCIRAMKKVPEQKAPGPRSAGGGSLQRLSLSFAQHEQRLFPGWRPEKTVLRFFSASPGGEVLSPHLRRIALSPNGIRVLLRSAPLDHATAIL